MKRISMEWTGPDSLREMQDDFPGVDVAVFRNDGTLVVSSGKRVPPVVQGKLKEGDTLFAGIQSHGITLVGSSSWSETEVGLRQLDLVLAALWLPLVALTVAVSWYGGGLVLRPVRELVTSAEALSEASDGMSLQTTDRAEFAALATSLNNLIGRVRHAASLQEQFASDAAHELRNPLALLRTRIESNLRIARSPEEHVRSQEALLRQIEKLTLVVESLLSSARRRAPIVGPIQLDDCVERTVHAWLELRCLPPETARLSLEPVTVAISIEDVDIVLRNLLDNSARFSTGSPQIEVQVTGDGSHAILTVRDFGSGLTDEEMKHAFERFYRSDPGRSREDGGAGIGLAVVKRIVESNQGRVKFVPVDYGAMVKILLPTCENESSG
ncbi:MAG: HAMP domain-containing histidine kinase [Armatimonadetes bacterium]|nr:HAMP domain-containing histidine kinase [Armatimonadota bacterium]